MDDLYIYSEGNDMVIGCQMLEMWLCYGCGHNQTVKVLGTLGNDGNWEKEYVVPTIYAEEFEYFMFVGKCPKCNSANIELIT